MNDIETIEDIKLFVDTFYHKIQNDELLAPVFAMRIEADNWQPHLDKMYSFWKTVLFHESGYKGSPFMKHSDLPIYPKHFDQWVALFNENIDSHFEGERTEDAKRRVKSMADLFMAKIEYYRNNPQAKPIV